MPPPRKPPSSTAAPGTIEPAATSRARFVPDEFPVPHYLIPEYLTQRPEFAPAPPRRGYYVYEELPRLKLRGLGPADSLILRHAIATKLIDVTRFYLAPLIPATSDPADLAPIPVSRDQLHTSPPPFLPDGAYAPNAPPIPAFTNIDRWPPAAPKRARHDIFVVEIKPNAGYVAAGQVLCYAWAWNRLFGDRWPAQPLILTDQPRPYLPEFGRHHGISLLALDKVLVEPPRFPT